jgi:DNA polymerase-3 subunit epsilon
MLYTRRAGHAADEALAPHIAEYHFGVGVQSKDERDGGDHGGAGDRPVEDDGADSGRRAQQLLRLASPPPKDLADRLLAIAQARPRPVLADEVNAAPSGERTNARPRQPSVPSTPERARVGGDAPDDREARYRMPTPATSPERRGALYLPDDLCDTPLADARFAVLDFETTGLFPQIDEIIEVGVVHVDGERVTRAFESLVRPGRRVPEEITRLTGIDAEMLSSAPPLDAVLRPLCDALDGRILVAHNAVFDVAFLDRALLRLAGHPWLGAVACTRRLARRFRPDLRRRSLDALCEAYGLRNPARHRAIGDAEATAHLLVEFVRLARNRGATTLHGLAKLSRERPGAAIDFSRYNFGPAFLAHLPRSPGIYRMRDARGEVIYVGKARDLHERVSSYFRGRARGRVAALREALYDLEVVLAASELEALLLESAEIRARRPRFNVQVGVRRRGFWLKVTRRGGAPPRIVSADPRAPSPSGPPPQPPSQPPLTYGPFIDPAGGREAARRLRLAFDLAGTPPQRPVQPEPFLERGEGADALVHAVEVALRRFPHEAEPKRAQALREALRTVRRIAAHHARAGDAHHRRDLLLRLPGRGPPKLWLLADGAPLACLAQPDGLAKPNAAAEIAARVRVLLEAPGSTEDSLDDEGRLVLDAWLCRHPPSALLDIGDVGTGEHLEQGIRALLEAPAHTET